MTSKSIDRRTFLSTGAKAGFTVCGLCVCSNFDSFVFAGEKIDPEKLNYCGYTCPDDCKFLQGTLNNDVELKKEAWKLWKIEERFGVEFDPEQAICYGCKSLDKPEGIVLARCTVRDCAQEKSLDCCIECGELPACDKDLWRRFPKFKEQVVEMQKKYRAQA
jgi:hypothetical protein